MGSHRQRQTLLLRAACGSIRDNRARAACGAGMLCVVPFDLLHCFVRRIVDNSLFWGTMAVGFVGGEQWSVGGEQWSVGLLAHKTMQ